MNFKRIALGVALLLSVSACSYVPAGNVGVKVNLLGGDKGVDSEVVGVGRYWLGWNEELYLFPTFMQNYVWTAGVDEGSPNDESISFQTADGMTANADIGISYSIDPEKVSVIFQTYRRGVEEITDTFLRNMVRDALVKQASNKPIEYVYGAGKADLIAAVQKDVADQVGPMGIMIGKIYWIGEIRLPPVVLESINKKNAATQMAMQRQNEVAQAKAEADKKIEDARGVAESILKVAEAQAKANKVLAESITPEFIQYQALEKWDGKLPTTMVPGQATPFINVK
jgi:regulator of protease activity HflC (stomatin/prohibitin superfamily)